MSTLCKRNEKIREAVEKHDFYDFPMGTSCVICGKCDSTNSEECLMEKAGFFKLNMEDKMIKYSWTYESVLQHLFKIDNYK